MTVQTFSVTEAVTALKQGEVICYPTETFYAVGCNALDPLAVESVYKAKKRSGSMPLPVLIGSMDQLPLVTDVTSDIVMALANRFWPGALSILVTASDRIPSVLTGETGRVAVRVTPHPVAQQLCLEAGVPLVSTSANMSGRPAVTAAASLDPELTENVAGVVDIEPAPAGGMASTLIEIVGPRAVSIVRNGAVSEIELRTSGLAVVPRAAGA
ncbi:L-threonylcarbamoyladenylate synthase [Halodesulfovibrio spirochaetisodalis]|uniref:L-threonylcarbamoyladenylate synthase n=1 Tax=Halodesulfovibrio spirochaetisodalis TaxID=1560234 RepID=A0A1B7X933_9BACT|nr:L-threonylcarbamoyladenylate synthase [Halodesulfovibrio spirochaetisodalis]OBQ45893.1 translation factor Sua5 [Halodesulfovibrio spirochaetisodalis]